MDTATAQGGRRARPDGAHPRAAERAGVSPSRREALEDRLHAIGTGKDDPAKATKAIQGGVQLSRVLNRTDLDDRILDRRCAKLDKPP